MRTARNLIFQSAPEAGCDHGERLAHALAWFLSQNERWAAATIRSYRAALLLALARFAAAGADDDTSSRLQLLFTGTPLPRSARARPRTSALKRRSFREDEQEKLFSYLSSRSGRSSELVAGLIKFGPIFGLRPSEWLTAKLRGDKLFVECAKHTNGRGLDDLRVIHITAMQPPMRAAFQHFIEAYQRTAREASSIDAFQERLTKTLQRACVKMKIPVVSFYTLRHQAIATAKVTMSLEEVAALAGHRTTRMASRSYAKRRSGWRRSSPILPSTECIRKVKISERTYFERAVLPNQHIDEIYPSFRP
jgi:integrase